MSETIYPRQPKPRDPTDPPVKAGHFEDKGINSFLDLYLSHADLAHQAHQMAANQFYPTDDTIPVELVGSSVLEEGVAASVSQYDVVSFSQGLTNMGALTSRLEELEVSNTIILGSAGNIGPNASVDDYVKTTPFDHCRNYAAVGEVSLNAEGKPVIDEHNSLDAISFLVDNPYDDQSRAADIIVPPDSRTMSEHRNYLEAFVRGYEKIDPEKEPEQFEARVEELIADPALVHDTLVSELGFHKEGNKEYGMDGTSFSSPTAAGYFSAIMNDQHQRETAGQTSLTADEVFMVGYLSTRPISAKEGQDTQIEYQANARGLLSASEAGYGYLDPELLQQNVEQALESKAQGRGQQTQTYKGTTTFSENEALDSYVFEVSEEHMQNQGVFKVVLGFNSERNIDPNTGFSDDKEEMRRMENAQGGVGSRYPIKIISPEGTVVERHVQMEVFNHPTSVSIDEFMGENLTGKWTIVAQDEGVLPFFNTSFEAHTYDKGGFIDELVAQKAQADSHHQSIDHSKQGELSSEVSAAYQAYLSSMGTEEKAKYQSGLDLVREINEFESDVGDVIEVSATGVKQELSEMDASLLELRQAFDAAIEKGYSVTQSDYESYANTAKETSARFR